MVWRVTFDSTTGVPIVDVAEVWAVGARSEGEVYDEMRTRVASLPQTPSTTALGGLIKRFEKSLGISKSPGVPTRWRRKFVLG